MWGSAQAYFDAHRAALASAGIPLAARLEADGGVMCSYAGGVVRLALPDPDAPGGALRATLLAASLGLDVDEVVWLFGALLPRLVGHEIGHALRDEAGRMGADLWAEEQAADRVACHLARAFLDGPTRARVTATLAGVVARTGGLPEALAGYRLEARARLAPDLAAVPTARLPPLAAYRDFPTFLRVSVAWSYLDARLDPEDDLHAIHHDLLLAR